MSEQIDKYREIVSKASEVDSIEAAMDHLDAYHKLDELGSEELDELRFWFVSGEIENEYLRRVFEYHLIECFDCLQKATNLKHFLKASREHGAEAVAQVEKAEKVKELVEARKLAPDNEDTEKSLESLKKIVPVKSIVSGVEKIIEWRSDTIVLPITRAGRVFIEIGGKKFFDKVLTADDYRGIVATATDYKDKTGEKIPLKVLTEKDGIRIEVEKGVKDGKIIITRLDG